MMLRNCIINNVIIFRSVETYLVAFTRLTSVSALQSKRTEEY
jgi:hypothetical protein